MKKPSNPCPTESLWQRFREDDKSSHQTRWGLAMIVLWLAAQSLLSIS